MDVVAAHAVGETMEAANDATKTVKQFITCARRILNLPLLTETRSTHLDPDRTW